MRQRALIAAVAILLTFSPVTLALDAMASEQGVVAVVNDQPITEHDITQRIALLKILGDGGSGISRKQALRSLIDQQVKISEAKRFNFMPSDSEIRQQTDRMAKNMGTDAGGLSAKLKKQGISAATFNEYVGALIGFNRIMSSKNRGAIEVSDSEVDAKMKEIRGKANAQIAKIMSDPRMKPVTVYSLLEINLPLESDDPMLTQARAVEAAQVVKRFNGCDKAKAATSGVFNVKIGKRFEADAAKLPKQLRAAFDKAGPGKAVGPIRGNNAIQLLGFCGSRKVTPEKPDFKMPTRDQVRRSLISEKYDGLEEDYLKTVRGNVYVEYRDASYAQQ